MDDAPLDDAPLDAAVVSQLPVDTNAQLLAGAIAARENNASLNVRDTSGRDWFIGMVNINNRSQVLLQVARVGGSVFEQYLGTDLFSAAAASAAITTLDGQLP